MCCVSVTEKITRKNCKAYMCIAECKKPRAVIVGKSLSRELPPVSGDPAYRLQFPVLSTHEATFYTWYIIELKIKFLVIAFSSVLCLIKSR